MPSPASICLFEDDHTQPLHPLTWLRPVYDLRCGSLSSAERVRRFFPGAVVYRRCRDYVAPLSRETDDRINLNPPDNCLYINGRALLDEDFVRRITADTETTWVSEGLAMAFWNNALSTRREEAPVRVIQYPWDLVRFNADMIREDFRFFKGNANERMPAGVHVVHPGEVHLGQDVVLKPGVVLDAEKGPIVIEPGVTIMSNAVLEGPCHVGAHSIVKIGAKIYGGTSIGPVCKVGGEIEASIVHGYSNKQHDGFLGHSYIGEWCNLGADTNTSDLKNNYGPVKVTIDGRTVDTGMMFVGLTMGDHSKSGINTMFNTGTVVGISANIVGGGFPPKYIPSFAWVDVPTFEEYRLEKAVEVARLVMHRRRIILTPEYEAAMKHVFHLTAEERERAKVV